MAISAGVSIIRVFTHKNETAKLVKDDSKVGHVSFAKSSMNCGQCRQRVTTSILIRLRIQLERCDAW